MPSDCRISDSPLTEQDVRDIVRLLGEVIAASGGFPEKRRLLMDGLCGLVNASSWAWCMAEFDPDKPPSFIGFEHGGWGEERFARYIEAMNHPEMEEITRPSSIELKERGTHLTRTQRQLDPFMRLESSEAGKFWAKADIGSLLISQRPMDGGGISGVAVYRRFGEAHFDEREARIAHIILSEVAWLHFQSFPDEPTREIARLYPRHRTVMNLLCEGWGRKRIADHLGLSVNTVHGYSKVIFRHFSVHSQAELVSRMTKGDGGDR
ncbi:helix-turn-helix transcriptional regulator [Luteolibacter flavescens]|uniref:Helix-turn-helix transcriptional regulator n=1 Tax=Luteolibacter flavescens TaxID=1859460 RepID=A0ABT3FLB6_9BACT|nr:helix-turn-helix transcriptional regulator [Luteolibacter flavescens]MCW1884382.1 helix-turn-helix transcriptional regulator [Luteolibacter flavescens]